MRTEEKGLRKKRELGCEKCRRGRDGDGDGDEKGRRRRIRSLGDVFAAAARKADMIFVSSQEQAWRTKEGFVSETYGGVESGEFMGRAEDILKPIHLRAG